MSHFRGTSAAPCRGSNLGAGSPRPGWGAEQGQRPRNRFFELSPSAQKTPPPPRWAPPTPFPLPRRPAPGEFRWVSTSKRRHDFFSPRLVRDNWMPPPVISKRHFRNVEPSSARVRRFCFSFEDSSGGVDCETRCSPPFKLGPVQKPWVRAAPPRARLGSGEGRRLPRPPPPPGGVARRGPRPREPIGPAAPEPRARAEDGGA